MEKRKFGRTGWEIGIIGLGGIPIQQCDQGQVNDLIQLAVDRGVNFIDTARAYTVSEKLIGGALKKIDRSKVYIATKTAGRTYQEAQEDFEISIKDLDIDTIDLYQFHNVSKREEYDQIMAAGGAMDFFKDMKKKGYIREIGITSHNADLLAEMVESEEFASVQFPYNAVESQGIPIFKRAKELNLGTIAMKPIAGGVLLNQGEESLRYILEDENLDTAIPGMYCQDEVIRNTAIGKKFIPLSEQERSDLMEEAQSLGTNFCRRCNYCQPCTVNINISNLFLLELYYEKYGLVDWATKRYEAATVKADACIECGVCEPRCPYELPIIDKLKHVDQIFSGEIQ